MRLLRFIPFLWLASVAAAGVVDRAAVVVGKTLFTESEVEQEARLTDFQAGKPLDLSASGRKQAADQLVDQELLRQEMSATGFKSAPQNADALLRDYRQKHFPSNAQFEAALARYGITADALKQRLVWEVTLLQFTDQRFKPLAALLAMPSAEEPSANRADSPVQPVAAPPAPSASAVDQQMDAWLQQQRQDTRIVYIPEAFQ